MEATWRAHGENMERLWRTYQVKISGHFYCYETIYLENGKMTKRSLGRCEKTKNCEKICGTLKKRRKNRPHRRFLRRLRSILKIENKK